MQTPHNGSGITVDSWTDGDDAYCAAEPRQSTEFGSLLRRRISWICIGAVTMAAALEIGLWSPAANQRYATKIGELGHVELPDGSMAILNTATEIELAFTHDVRRVRLLRGEALFDVAADPHRTFVTEVGGFRVETPAGRTALPRKNAARVGWLVDYARDIAVPLTRRASRTLFATRGTTFTVRRRSLASIDLAVLEGSVEVRHRAPNKLIPALIREDTTVKVVDGELREAINVNVGELVAEVSWLERRVALVGATTLGEAVEEFNRYNKVQLLLEGTIGERQIRGAFQIDRPRDFARVMEIFLNVESRVNGDSITIPDPAEEHRGRQ